MRYKNTLRLAKITTKLCPCLSGAPKHRWYTFINRIWNDTSRCLWRKHMIQRPTQKEIGVAASLCEMLTATHQQVYERERSRFLDARMTETAFRAFT